MVRKIAGGNLGCDGCGVSGLTKISSPVRPVGIGVPGAVYDGQWWGPGALGRSESSSPEWWRAWPRLGLGSLEQCVGRGGLERPLD